MPERNMPPVTKIGGVEPDGDIYPVAVVQKNMYEVEVLESKIDYSNPQGTRVKNDTEVHVAEKHRRDPVNHPAHYGGDVTHEVIKCLQAWGLESDALLWNAVKYIARWDKKDTMLVNLKKAQFYLNRRIEQMEKEHAREVKGDV